MASAENSHSSDRQKSTKMTNSNHEPTNQNYHQQELIRMLAQHFNNQLAANRTGSTADLPLLPPVNSAGSAMNNFQSALVHYQQQSHQQQYRMNQDAINFSTQDRAANSEPASSQSSFITSQQSARSHQATLTSVNPFSITNPITTNGPTILPIAHQNPAACNPFMNDMNLFNALNCFGIPNDQLVLSLQQQYLIQAATAARQIESRLGRGDNGNSILINEQQASSEAGIRQNQQQLLNKRMLNGHLSDLSGEITSNQGRRELLKFSINTILGRRSPSCTTNGNQLRADSSPINGLFDSQGGQQLLAGNKIGEDNAHETLRNTEKPISPECDPDIMTDVDSESSSAGPNPQSNSGMATNLSRMSSDLVHSNRNLHQSASSSTTTKQGMPTDSLVGGEPDQSGHHHTSLSFLTSSTSFPWTVASRGKPRRGMMRRAVFSDSQRVGLEKRFQMQKYISKPDRKKLAEKLGLRDSQVKIWFQNRRMKWRNSKERELLSAGGSREQTLPTRNNPNPDLSDVGQTFKRLVSGPSNLGTV